MRRDVRVRALAQHICEWFFSGCASAAAAWFALAIACMAVLAWFFVFSPFGAPAGPVYAEF